MAGPPPGLPGCAPALAACVPRLCVLADLNPRPQVCFDRGGFRYHGRVQALADAAREAGLNF